MLQSVHLMPEIYLNLSNKVPDVTTVHHVNCDTLLLLFLKFNIKLINKRRLQPSETGEKVIEATLKSSVSKH